MKRFLCPLFLEKIFNKHAYGRILIEQWAWAAIKNGRTATGASHYQVFQGHGPFRKEDIFFLRNFHLHIRKVPTRGIFFFSSARALGEDGDPAWRPPDFLRKRNFDAADFWRKHTASHIERMEGTIIDGRSTCRPPLKSQGVSFF